MVWLVEKRSILYFTGSQVFFRWDEIVIDNFNSKSLYDTINKQ